MSLIAPAGRQGPGAVPGSAIAAVDLVLARRTVGALPGDHLSPGVGAGTELAQLRPYESGDDPRQLDPAASARTAQPHVRLHVPERTLTTWIVLDVSPSMTFGTDERLKSDVAEGVASVLAHVAVRRGGRVSLLLAGAGHPHVLPPRGGRRAVAGVRRLLAQGAAPDGTVPGEDLAGALGRVRRLARQPGLVVVISDFRDGSGWARALHVLGARHGLIAVEVRDRREDVLPDVGRVLVMDPETGRQVEADTSSARLRAAFAQAEATRRRALGADLRRIRARHVPLTTGGEWLRELASALGPRG